MITLRKPAVYQQTYGIEHIEHPCGRLMMTAAYLLEFWSKKEDKIPEYSGLIEELRNGRDKLEGSLISNDLGDYHAISK